MITIIINGRIRNKKKIYAYVDKLAMELKIDKHHTKHIEINLVNNINDSSFGECEKESDRDIVINIARWRLGKKITYTDQIMTITHEMIHAKQYIKNELNDTMTVWKGKPCLQWINQSWDKQPWEVEACNLEHDLYRKCWPAGGFAIKGRKHE